MKAAHIKSLVSKRSALNGLITLPDTDLDPDSDWDSTPVVGS